MKLSQLGSEIRARVLGRRGQNTVEYLLMLTVVVAVVLVAGAALRNYMPQMFASVQALISGAITQMGGSGGS